MSAMTGIANSYRARRRKLQELAIRQGIDPQPLPVSKFTGIPHRTVKRAFNGGTLSPRTVQRFLDTLGGTLDDVFEPGE
jgi:hypothetical protein